MKDQRLDDPKTVAKHFDAALHDGRPDSRRKALRTLGKLGLGAAVLGAGSFLTAREAQGSSAADNRALAHDILNFALTLEYLEMYFYEEATGVLDRDAIVPDGDMEVFNLIRDHERAHVDFLTETVNSLEDGPDAVVYERSDFDFSVLGTDPFANGNYGFFLTLSMGFEDLGVRAYKGQAPNILGTPYLTPALQIHSVEARHAAEVRRIRAGMDVNVQPWIVGDSGTDGTPLEAVYAGSDNAAFDDVDSVGDFPPEENVVQPIGTDITSDLANDYSSDDASAAFDEPISMPAVLSIAGPFIVGEEGDGSDDNDSD